jgi:hypothetical protein
VASTFDVVLADGRVAGVDTRVADGRRAVHLQSFRQFPRLPIEVLLLARAVDEFATQSLAIRVLEIVAKNDFLCRDFLDL